MIQKIIKQTRFLIWCFYFISSLQAQSLELHRKFARRFMTAILVNWCGGFVYEDEEHMSGDFYSSPVGKLKLGGAIWNFNAVVLRIRYMGGEISDISHGWGNLNYVHVMKKNTCKYIAAWSGLGGT